MNHRLKTEYLGLKLESPLVVGACPLCGYLSNLEKFQIAGAGAVVLQSVFEEQIEQAQTAHFAKPGNGLQAAYSLPRVDDYNAGIDAYLRLIENAKRELTMPIIASLNGSTVGDWIRFAELIEQAGADALELNIYLVPTDEHLSAQEIENRYADLVAAVRAVVQLPLAVKIGPYFTALPHFAQQLVHAGADGLVLFNRFLEPEIDLERMEVSPHLDLSTTREVRLPLRWLAILRDKLSVSLAATSGIHTAREVCKVLLAGADVAMLSSALIHYGPSYLTEVRDDLLRWLDAKNLASVDAMRGLLSRHHLEDPTAYERANYLKALLNTAARL